MRDGSPWNWIFLARLVQPVVQVRVVGDQFLDPRVGAVDVLGVAGQRGPAEGTDSAAEQGADVGRHETRKVERVLDPGAERLLADVVAVVERGHPGCVEAEHGADVDRDRLAGCRRDRVGLAVPARLPLFDAPADRQVAVGRVVCRCLIGQRIGPDAAGQQFGQHFRGVAEQADGQRRPRFDRGLDRGQRLVEGLCPRVEVPSLKPLLDPVRLTLDREQRRPGHLCRQRLRSSHAAESGGQDPAPGEIPAVVLAAHLDERLVGALDDSLAADVDPRSGGHLPVHHQTQPVEFPEVLPGRPRGNEVRVGDEHPRSVGVGSEHPDRLSGLDDQRFVGFEFPQRLNDRLVGFPVARRLADPP